jgi:hypothetical protein
MYINGYHNVGDKGFLVSQTNRFGVETNTLNETPAHTNGSYEPRLFGWCGTYNDTATYGDGLAVITKIYTVDRARGKKLYGKEALRVLRELGRLDLRNQLEP